MQVKDAFKRIDYILILLMLLLTGVGFIAIHSSTAYTGDTSLIAKQLVFFGIGFVVMIIVVCIDYHLLASWYMLIYIGIIGLLVAVLIFGDEVNGAKRWITILGQSIQPSEFAKIGMILCSGVIMNKYNNRINQLWPVLIIGAFWIIPFVLVYKQPNLSTSIILLSILVIQLFMTKINMKYVLATVLVCIPIAVAGFVYIVNTPDQTIIEDYQRKRIMSLVTGGDSSADKYQTSRAVQAIGSGGLNGKGLAQGSISQLNFLPESHNDFIVAVIGEEFGFIGITSVIGLMLLFVFRGLWIARRAPDDLGKFIVVGYMGMIAIQAFVNMGVVTDLLPNTGVTIPFISYGGSSLWANMMGVGLVLNVARYKEEKMF